MRRTPLTTTPRRQPRGLVVVGVRICVLRTPVTAARQFDMPLGEQPTRVLPNELRIRWGAQRRHPANTIERSVRSGDAASRPITLTTCQISCCS